MNDFAKMGFDAMKAAFAKAAEPKTGFTAPSVTYDKMRQINASVIALDSDVKANVKREVFKNAWAAWKGSWDQFFKKQSDDFYRAGNIFMSDELAAQTESYRVQLEGWQTGYRVEAGIPLVGPVIPKEPEKDSGVKWWAVSLATLGMLGVGALLVYGFLKAKREADAKRLYLEQNVLPKVMGATMGPIGVDFAHAAAQHDPPPPYVALDPARAPNVILLSR
jgi:hypothetical protein